MLCQGVTTHLKDLLTEEHLRSLGLTERQVKAVRWVKQQGRIPNAEYQRLNAVSKASATRDLTDLVAKGVLKTVGTGKRSLHYVLNEPKMNQT